MAEWVNNWLVDNVPRSRLNRYFIFGYKDFLYGATTNCNNWQYLYKYDLRTNTWSDTPVATAPPNYAFATFQDYSADTNRNSGEEMFIKLTNRTSGQDYSSYYGIYNARLKKWTHLVTSRINGSGVAYFDSSTKKIYSRLPSGYAGNYHDEVYIYDMVTNTTTTTPRILGSYTSSNKPDIKSIFVVNGKIYAVMTIGYNSNNPYIMYVYDNGSWTQKQSKTPNINSDRSINFLEYHNNTIYWYDYDNVIYSYNTSTDTWGQNKTTLRNYSQYNGGSRCNCNGIYLFVDNSGTVSSVDNEYVLYDYKNDKLKKFGNMPINLRNTSMNYEGYYYNGLAYFNLTNKPENMLFYRLGDYTFENSAPTIPPTITHGAFTKKTINDQVVITWGASTDKENDSIVYELYFFNGDSWIAIASDLTDLIYKYIIPSNAYNTTSAKFKVCASDGFISSDFIESSIFEIYGANVLNSPPTIKGEVIYN